MDRGENRAQHGATVPTTNLQPEQSSVRIAAGAREYLEVLVVISVVTLAAWFVPVDYRAFGDIYLLTVIGLCLRVGRWPILFATVLSALAWNFVIMPPRMSFSRLDLKDGVFLGMYLVVSLIAGQLTARIREQQREEKQREQRATALFHLTRALSDAETLEDAVGAALGQAESLFGAQSALLMKGQGGALMLHPASGFTPDHRETEAARELCSAAPAIGRGRRTPGALLVPVIRAGATLGVFALKMPALVYVPPEQRELMEAFAAQIGLQIERDHLRAAAEREKLLTESDRLHRTLLDSVSHEFKTPVAVLRSAAESIVHAEGARREALAREIRTAGRRLDHLVANLLNQTRLEAGRVKPKLDWCDVRDLISAARRAVGDPLNGRPFKVEVPEDMPLCMADAMLMEHVLANLLLNAVHHTPPGTPIAVRAGNEPKAARVFIAVCDRGPGIPASKRVALFQKFERGDRARSGGLGLGLSIVRGFMLAQGGDVAVDENPGGGARFTLFLPHRLHETVPQE
jgi:two-component system sensor histidine kinase KdpD